MWWQWVCSRWKLLLHYSTWPKEQVWVCSINDTGCDGVCVCVCGDLQRCRESLHCSLPGRVWSGHPGWLPHEAPLGSGWTQLQMHTQSHAHNTKQSNKHSHSEHRGKQRKVLININGMMTPPFCHREAILEGRALRRLNYAYNLAPGIKRGIKLSKGEQQSKFW